jgi:murein DD-endopeptidase MepM/ murein hydrolase activator NlpD
MAIRFHSRCVLILFLVLAGATGCSTLKSQQDSADEGHDEDEEAMAASGPTLSWSGERKYIRPDQPLAFDWPVDEARMTRGFILGKRRSHWGVDLAAAKGTDILAAERGVVVYTGKGFRGFGNLIVIEHNEEWATLYSHLSKIMIKEGAVVDRGQKIGEMGRTGRATGVHLHFEIRHNRQPVNPLTYLPEGY